MKKQGGQDIVEFALMIPLFLAFLVGIALFGLYFSDWVSYNNFCLLYTSPSPRDS